MLGNISDCVKKIFRYFTALVVLAWIYTWIILSESLLLQHISKRRNMKSHQSSFFNTFIYVCQKSWSYFCFVYKMNFLDHGDIILFLYAQILQTLLNKPLSWSSSQKPNLIFDIWKVLFKTLVNIIAKNKKPQCTYLVQVNCVFKIQWNMYDRAF